MSNTLATAEPKPTMTTETKPSSSRKYAIIAIKWVLAAVCLVVLYKMSGGNLIKLKDRRFVWSMLGIAIGLRFFPLLLTFGRWQILVRGIGLPLSFSEAFRLGMLGEACNCMGPGAVGGDIVKAGMLFKDHPQRTASVLATVFLDRVIGMWTLFMMGAFASITPWGAKLGADSPYTLLILWSISIGGLVGLVLMFVPAFTHSRLMHWLTTLKFVGKVFKELMNSVQLYQGKPGIIISATVLGLIGHLGFLTCFYFCAETISEGQPIPGLVDHIVGLPLPEAIGAFSPTPGGIGGLEFAVATFYQEYQRSTFPDSTAEQLAAASTNGMLTAALYRLTMALWGAVGVVFYLSSRKEIERAVQSVEATEA